LVTSWLIVAACGLGDASETAAPPPAPPPAPRAADTRSPTGEDPGSSSPPSPDAGVTYAQASLVRPGPTEILSTVSPTWDLLVDVRAPGTLAIDVVAGDTLESVGHFSLEVTDPTGRIVAVSIPKTARGAIGVAPKSVQVWIHGADPAVRRVGLTIFVAGQSNG